MALRMDDAIRNATRRKRRRRASAAGFTLIEAMVALSVLMVGLLGMAGVMAAGLKRMGSAPTDVIARQKAAEAIESVYTARDTRTRTWAQIHNVQGGSGSDAGVFLDGLQPLKDPGADGLMNTADDGAVETLVQPGPDGRLGTTDDITTPLSNYAIEIRIRDLSATLRSLQITVRLQSGIGTRDYVVNTLISSYS
ncbi:MAG: prepilin-type N-terminal cleavage/methylation domain-containing protein [Acidobacteria bacterium]|nr:prepilin-type N-terminal cleavage/methylation domain-containing protein [Acidobacteriota bacterium]